MPEKPRLYLETTIPSYLVARPSRDLVISARQQITHDWWETQRQNYEIFIAQPVLDEVSRGDAAYSRDRLNLLQSLARLAITPEVEDYDCSHDLHSRRTDRIGATTMNDDPIVREVRKAREEIAAEEGYDLHRLVERFRREQEAHPEQLVRLPPRPLQTTPSVEGRE